MDSSKDLSFLPHVKKDKIFIKIVDDSIIEGDEDIFVTILTTDPNVKIDKQKQVTTVTIIDNDGKCTFTRVSQTGDL